jgi:hypothetical protein
MKSVICVLRKHWALDSHLNANGMWIVGIWIGTWEKEDEGGGRGR